MARNKPAQAKVDMQNLMDLEIHYAAPGTLYASAIDLAIRLDHHLFDALYHALALETPGAFLVSADRRYYEKARSFGKIVRLADLKLAS